MACRRGAGTGWERSGSTASCGRSVRVGTLIAPLASSQERSGNHPAAHPSNVTYVDPMETAVRRRAADALQELLPSLTAEATGRLGRAEAVAFLARLETHLLDI